MYVHTFRGFATPRSEHAISIASEMVMEIFVDGFDEEFQWANILDEPHGKWLYFVCISDGRLLVRNVQTQETTETILFG